MKKRTFALAVALAMVTALSVTTLAARNTGFPDVKEDVWYADAVQWAAQNGIINGYSDGTFGPDDPVTRAQLAVILWRYAGCPGVEDAPETKVPAPDGTVTPSEEESKVLIAYFSWSGHTKQIAEEIQAQTGADLFEIVPETPYTENINDLSGIALREQRENARPTLGTHVEDMEQYDVVFVGYPCWWSDMPMAVCTFLEEYDFSGKQIVPFTAYGENVFGRSLTTIENLAVGAAVSEGLAVQEHHMDDLSRQVSEWLENLKIHVAG